jgi:uncharacterized membrane protein
MASLSGVTGSHQPAETGEERNAQSSRPRKGHGGEPTLSGLVSQFTGKADIMDSIMDFFSSWTFMIIMAVLLIALIGLLLFLRNRRPED